MYVYVHTCGYLHILMWVDTYMCTYVYHSKQSILTFIPANISMLLRYASELLTRYVHSPEKICVHANILLSFVKK